MRTLPLTLCTIALALAAAACAQAQTNLLPNPDFNDPKGPLTGWRIDFPYWGSYVGNAPYFKISADHQQGSAHSVEVSMPKGVAEGPGAKIESTFLKVDPGATYHGAVDVISGDYTIKVQAEAWAVDPTPLTKSDLFRIPPLNGLPGLVMCYRSDFPDQPAGSKVWTTAKKDFKVPAQVYVAGKPSQPSYLTLKVFVFSGTTATVPNGKAYIGRTLLTELKK
jgi:hypothetical protein